jgi:hypothetical protein
MEEEEEEGAVAAAAAAAPLPAPTAREVAAAEAARQRLYGNDTSAAAAAPSSAAAPAAVVLPSGTPPPVAVDVPLRSTSELEPLSLQEEAGRESESTSVSASFLLASAVSALTSDRKWDDVARGLDAFRRGVKHHRAEALAVL